MNKPNPCCNINQNLEAHRDPDNENLMVRVCRICGRRHFELSVDAGKLFGELK